MQEPDPGPVYTAAQQKVIDVIGKTGPAPAIPTGLAAELRAEIDAAIAPFTDLLPDGKSWENRFFLNKQSLTDVHSCEAYYLGGKADFEWNSANSRGTIVHKAIEVSINIRGGVAPTDLVEESISRLSNDPNKNIGEFLVTLDEYGRAELIGECSSLFTRFLEGFPPIKRAWSPQTESAIGIDLVDKRVRIGGKVDLSLGRPPDKVIIDLKTGAQFGAHRDDLRLYALIDLLTVGNAPRKVASFYIDSVSIEAEDITEGTLRAAARRLADGLTKALEIKYAGRAPEVRAGSNCRWCTLVSECQAGQQNLARREADEGW
ncbi:MAG: PD-(D/E)XK nuclease family protein [Actinomycetota bacterium]